MRGTDQPFINSFPIVVTCRFINRSVSLSPPYLIHLLILHPRTSSKKGALCSLCQTDTKQGKRQNRYQNRTGERKNITKINYSTLQALLERNEYYFCPAG